MEEGSYNRPLSDIEEIAVFCDGIRISTRNVSNYVNISLHLKRLLMQHRFLHTGLQPTRSMQRENLRNDPTHHGILRRQRTVPPMLVYLQAQNHVRTVARYILQDVLCVHIHMQNTNKNPWKESVTETITRGPTSW